MGSAETTDKGRVELGIHGTVLRPWYGDSHRWGVGGRLGIGLTPRLEVEVKGANFEDVAYVGGGAKVWLLRGRSVDVAGTIGLQHISGLQPAILVSGHAAPRLQFYAGLKVRFEWLEGFHDTEVHVVPGLEYSLADDLDFQAEAGLAMNHDSRPYVSFGLAFYPR